jgi:hypothetical protein
MELDIPSSHSATAEVEILARLRGESAGGSWVRRQPTTGSSGVYVSMVVSAKVIGGMGRKLGGDQGCVQMGKGLTR